MIARIPWLRRGSWAPGLQSDLSLIAMWVFATEAMLRGIDYLMGEYTSSSLSIVERALPMSVWGILFMLGSAIFMVGIIRRRFGPIITGSLLLMALYITLSVGTLWRVIEYGWPIDGWRTPAFLLAIGILNGLYALSSYLKRSAWIAQTRMCGED